MGGGERERSARWKLEKRENGAAETPIIVDPLESRVYYRARLSLDVESRSKIRA